MPAVVATRRIASISLRGRGGSESKTLLSPNATPEACACNRWAIACFDCGGIVELLVSVSSRRTRIVEIRTAPMIAEPSEMPICRNVLRTPEASPASRTCTEDSVRLLI